MSTTKLENLLRTGTGGSLDKIIQTAQNMDVLTSALKASIGPDMGENLIAANVHDDGEMVVICSSSAWAARIRFEADALLAAAVHAGFKPATCKVTVSQRQ